jgi:hypothetical protein
VPLGAWAALVAAVALLYGWTLDGYFVSDDFGFVGHFSTFAITSWPRLFIADWQSGIWGGSFNELRPFSALTFIIDSRLWGSNGAGYHFTNLVMHVACSGLVMLITQSLLRNWPGALLAGLLFALHPVQREAVIWITGRVDMLSAAGFLLGFYGLLRYRGQPRGSWLVVAWSGFGFGIFAKESCLLLPAVALLHDIAIGRRDGQSRRRLLAPYAGWLVLTVVYGMCRWIAMDVPPGGADGVDVALGIERGTRRLVSYVGAMFLPRDTLRGVIEQVAPWFDWAGAAVAGAIIAGVAVVLARPALRRSEAMRVALVYGIAWPVMTAGPLIVTYFSLRHLYTASAGFMIGVVALVTFVWPGRRAFAAAAALLVSGVVLQTLPGMLEWRASQLHSRQIHEAVARVAERAEPQSVVLLDVPDHRQDRWVWAWAAPFAFGPPFHPNDLTRRFVLLGPPAVHHIPEAWPPAGTANRLSTAAGAGWLISSTPDGRVTIRKLDAALVKRAVRSVVLEAPEAFDTMVETIESDAQ